MDDIEGAANANFLSIWVNLKTETLKPGDAKPSAIVEFIRNTWRYNFSRSAYPILTHTCRYELFYRLLFRAKKFSSD